MAAEFEKKGASFVICMSDFPVCVVTGEEDHAQAVMEAQQAAYHEKYRDDQHVAHWHKHRVPTY